MQKAYPWLLLLLLLLNVLVLWQLLRNQNSTSAGFERTAHYLESSSHSLDLALRQVKHSQKAIAAAESNIVGAQTALTQLQQESQSLLKGYRDYQRVSDARLTRVEQERMQHDTALSKLKSELLKLQ